MSDLYFDFAWSANDPEISGTLARHGGRGYRARKDNAGNVVGTKLTPGQATMFIKDIVRSWLRDQFALTFTTQ